MVKVKHKKTLDIIFRSPISEGEFYEPHTQLCYIFWSSNETESKMLEYVVESINHAELHFRIQQLEGIIKTRKFDDVADKVFEWDGEVYNTLY